MVDLEQELLDRRIIALAGALDDAAVGDVVGKLLHLGGLDAASEVQVHLTSVSASPSAALTLHDAISTATSPVRTVARGSLGPGGAALLVAGRAGMRVALPSTRISLRLPDFDVGGPTGRRMESVVAEVGYLRDRLVAVLVAASTQPRATVEEDIRRSVVLDAEAARAYGLIDEIDGLSGP